VFVQESKILASREIGSRERRQWIQRNCEREEVGKCPR